MCLCTFVSVCMFCVFLRLSVLFSVPLTMSVFIYCFPCIFYVACFSSDPTKCVVSDLEAAAPIKIRAFTIVHRLILSSSAASPTKPFPIHRVTQNFRSNYLIRLQTGDRQLQNRNVVGNNGIPANNNGFWFLLTSVHRSSLGICLL